MLDDIHSLASELPEHKETIHQLKMTDNHFARLLDEYNDLDKKILHLEQAGTPVSDASVEELKKRRLQLKDELFGMINRKAS